MNDHEEVADYYNANTEREWKRIERHPVEFEITKRILEKYLPAAPAGIIDIGGGPGRYSFWLSKAGYEVSLLDLAQNCIDFAKEESKRQNVKIRDFMVGNVLELDNLVQDRVFDVALLMGPMYHLTAEEDRVTAIRKTLGKLKKNGLIVVSFISAYAPVLDALKYNPEELRGNVARYAEYLDKGVNVVTAENPGFTSAYFVNPARVDEFMSQFNVEKLGLYTAESILGPFEKQLLDVDKQIFDSCIELGMKFVEDDFCRACGEHLLFVGKNR